MSSRPQPSIDAKPDMGVTSNAQLLLGFIAGWAGGDPNGIYQAIDADPVNGRLLIENVVTKNTYVVSVVQLTGVAYV